MPENNFEHTGLRFVHHFRSRVKQRLVPGPDSIFAGGLNGIGRQNLCQRTFVVAFGKNFLVNTDVIDNDLILVGVMSSGSLPVRIYQEGCCAESLK